MILKRGRPQGGFFRLAASLKPLEKNAVKKKPSQTDTHIAPDHDHDSVTDSAENAPPVDEAPENIDADDNASDDDDAGDNDELSENPRPAQRDEPAKPAAPAPPAAPAAKAPAPGGDAAPAKRGPGRPRKAATPAKKDAPAPGADVAPKGPARSEQVEQLRGLLQLRASAIGSIACQLAGWPPLTSEEGALIDAEFEGWEPPAELRKAVVLGLVVLPRAASDNRLRRLVGLGPVDGGDAPEVARQQLAQQRAELERQQAELAQAQAQLRQQAEQPKPAAPAPAPAPAPAASKRRPAPAQQDDEPVKIVIPEGFI